MLTNSFIFLDGISDKGEQNIWNQGILSWNDFFAMKRVKGISPIRKIFLDNEINNAKKALLGNDSGFFWKRLQKRKAVMWKLYPHFKDEAVFLDIETAGWNKGSFVTVVGISDGFDSRILVKGINLDFGIVRKIVSHAKLLVTFNGSAFDIPILRRYIKDFPDVPHLDLMRVCESAGLSGGLKEIEMKLGIARNLDYDIKGGDAISLWRMYSASGNDEYLKLLMRYNEEDVINLKRIADVVVQRLIGHCLINE